MRLRERLRSLRLRLGLVRRQIFLSYRRSDSAVADAVATWASRRYGAGRVFFDTEDNVGAPDWEKRVMGAVAGSSAVVAVVARGWLERAKRAAGPVDWVRRELLHAQENDVPVQPFYYVAEPDKMAGSLDQVEMAPDLKELLTRPHVISAFRDLDDGYDDLARALDPVLGWWNRRWPRYAAVGIVLGAVVTIGAVVSCAAFDCGAPGPFDRDEIGIAVARPGGGTPLDGGQELRVAEALAGEAAAAFGEEIAGSPVAVAVRGTVDATASDGGAADAAALVDGSGAELVIVAEVRSLTETETTLRPVAYLGDLRDLEELRGRRLAVRFDERSTINDLARDRVIAELLPDALAPELAPVVALISAAEEFKADAFGPAIERLEPHLDSYSGVERAAAEQMVANSYAAMAAYDRAREHYGAAADAAKAGKFEFLRADLGLLEADFLAGYAMCRSPGVGDLERIDADLAAWADRLRDSAGTGSVLFVKAEVFAIRARLCLLALTVAGPSDQLPGLLERLLPIVTLDPVPDEVNEAVVVAALVSSDVLLQAKGDPVIGEQLLGLLPERFTGAGGSTDERLHRAATEIIDAAVEETSRAGLRADARQRRASLLWALRDLDAAAADFQTACRRVRELRDDSAGTRPATKTGYISRLDDRLADLQANIDDLVAEGAREPDGGCLG